MLKFEEICELLKLVASNGITVLELEDDGSRLRIEGPKPVQVAAPAPPPQVAAPQPAVQQAQPAPQPPAPAPAPPSDQAQQEGEEDNLHFVTSPIVGTFYRAPNPDADPYVKVGDRVEKGQVLCIVEAMKLMNEIESDVAGTIVKIYPENGQPVEFGEKLFAIKPA